MTKLIIQNLVELSKNVVYCNAVSLCTHLAEAIGALNHELDARWREFGTHLCVKPSSMDSIEKDNKSDVGACMLHLVENWLFHENGTGTLPRTWETVVQAVKKTGKGRMAKQLAEKHGV